MASSPACGTCGAPVAMVGLDPARCRHCGGTARLDPATAARVEAFRARLAGADVRFRQVDGTLGRFGQGIGAFEIFASAILWAVIGGSLVAGAAGNLPDGVGLFDVLADPAVTNDDFAAATFWITHVVVTGFASSCLFVAIVQLASRGQVRVAHPVAPAVPGGPMGCRVCGADLPAGGLVRRCGFCQADHVADGVHFARVADDLEARLAARELALSQSIRQRQQVVRWLERVTRTPPLLAVVAFPLVFFLGEPVAELWAVPGAVLVVAAALFGLDAAIARSSARA